MKYSFSDLEQIGQAYDIIKKSLIVVDMELTIIYANSYAKEILGWEQDEWTNKSLIKMCKSLKLPNLIDSSTFEVYKEPVQLSNCIKAWNLMQVLVCNEKKFFLTDNDITEIENIHVILADKIKKITGQNPPAKKDLLWYTDEIHHCLLSVISQLPGYIYWKDKNFKYIFANDHIAKSLGYNSGEEIIGKSDYDFGWDKSIVNEYRKVDELILETGQPVLNIEETVLAKNGQELHLLVNKVPMRNLSGEIIGILGINIDITAEKEASQLKNEIEIEKNKAIETEQKRFKEFILQITKQMSVFEHIIGEFKFNHLSNKIGDQATQKELPKYNVKLSKREREILYYLSLNKVPKEIAAIIVSNENKDISPATIQSYIKRLYVKLNVVNVSQLIQRANSLGLIPFILENNT